VIRIGSHQQRRKVGLNEKSGGLRADRLFRVCGKQTQKAGVALEQITAHIQHRSGHSQQLIEFG